MTDTYGVGGQTTNARPTSRQTYRGPRVRSQSTGQTYYWVEGEGYVLENDPRRLTPQDRAARQDVLDEATGRAAMIPDFDRFLQLNGQVPTGSLTQKLGSAFGGQLPRIVQSPQLNIAPRIGLSLGNGEAYDEMTAIQRRWAPQQRPTGSGSSSNLDVSMYLGAIPNVSNPGDTNRNIVQGYRTRAQNAQDRRDFLEWYWPRTGSMTNWQAEWRRYEQARARDPQLSWRQFFNADSAGGAPAQQQQRPQSQSQSQFTPGQVYRDANGNRARYNADGSWTDVR